MLDIGFSILDHCRLRLDFARDFCSSWVKAQGMSDSLTAKCSCEHCGVHLEFPVESAGVRIACPNCGQQTEFSTETAHLNGARRGRNPIAFVIGNSAIERFLFPLTSACDWICRACALE